jgi:hypothetical protein
MSKYAALTDYLGRLPHREVRLTFGDIERLLKAKLPKSARSHRAWWSNNGNNSVMTKAWLDAGWRSERVDMTSETLVFRRVDADEPTPAAAAPSSDVSAPRRPRIIGRLRGTVTITGDVTQAVGEVWNAEQGIL